MTVPEELDGKQDGIAEKCAVAAGLATRRYCGGDEDGDRSVSRVARRSEEGFGGQHESFGRPCGFRTRR